MISKIVWGSFGRDHFSGPVRLFHKKNRSNKIPLISSQVTAQLSNSKEMPSTPRKQQKGSLQFVHTKISKNKPYPKIWPNGS